MIKPVSFKTAKHLESLSFPQEDMQYYWGIKELVPILLFALDNGFVDQYGHLYQRDIFKKFYAAPIGEEIMKLLPNQICAYRLKMVDTKEVLWLVSNHMIKDYEIRGEWERSVTLSEAAAEYWINAQ